MAISLMIVVLLCTVSWSVSTTTTTENSVETVTVSTPVYAGLRVLGRSSRRNADKAAAVSAYNTTATPASSREIQPIPIAPLSFRPKPSIPPAASTPLNPPSPPSPLDLDIPDTPLSPPVSLNSPSPFNLLSQLDLLTPDVDYCNPSAPPPCVDEKFGFCLGDDEYPEEEIKMAMELSDLARRFSYKPSPNDSRSRQLEIAKNAESGCLSQSLLLKPIRAANVDGDWRVIVQDASDIIQRERIVTCVSTDVQCQNPQYFAPVQCYTTRCYQQYLTRRLLSFDPCNPARGVFVDSFKMPSACSCRLSRMPC